MNAAAGARPARHATAPPSPATTRRAHAERRRPEVAVTHDVRRGRCAGHPRWPRHLQQLSSWWRRPVEATGPRRSTLIHRRSAHLRTACQDRRHLLSLPAPHQRAVAAVGPGGRGAGHDGSAAGPGASARGSGQRGRRAPCCLGTAWTWRTRCAVRGRGPPSSPGRHAPERFPRHGCAWVLDPRPDEQHLLRLLQELVPHGDPGALFYETDADLLLVSRNRDPAGGPASCGVPLQFNVWRQGRRLSVTLVAHAASAELARP